MSSRAHKANLLAKCASGVGCRRPDATEFCGNQGASMRSVLLAGSCVAPTQPFVELESPSAASNLIASLAGGLCKSRVGAIFSPSVSTGSTSTFGRETVLLLDFVQHSRLISRLKKSFILLHCWRLSCGFVEIYGGGYVANVGAVVGRRERP